MVDQQLVDRIEDTLEQDQDELEADLPRLLSEMEGRTDDLVRDHPQVRTTVLSRMEGMDIASFVSENPGIADQFQELLWSGLHVVVERNPEVKARITESVTTNFEADDCPMAGHLRVDADEETITGGTGHLDDADLTITGPADVLVGLVTGNVDPIQGLITKRFELDGSMSTATTLAPVMSALSNQLPD